VPENSIISKLSEKERRLMQEIIILFYKHCRGYGNRMMNDRVISYLGERGHKISGERFREVLGIIRRNDSCTKYLKKYCGIVRHAFIVSEPSRSGGYWWTEDQKEMRRFWIKQLGRTSEEMKNVGPLSKLFDYNEQQLQIIEFINEALKSIA
jgi:hypothetical protein